MTEGYCQACNHWTGKPTLSPLHKLRRANCAVQPLTSVCVALCILGLDSEGDNLFSGCLQISVPVRDKVAANNNRSDASAHTPSLA